MKLYINGEAVQTSAVLLSDLLAELGLQDKRIAVEIEGQLVPKSRHASTRLAENSSVEIIQAVGGG